jgi:hypothetical protein
MKRNLYKVANTCRMRPCDDRVRKGRDYGN